MQIFNFFSKIWLKMQLNQLDHIALIGFMILLLYIVGSVAGEYTKFLKYLPQFTHTYHKPKFDGYKYENISNRINMQYNLAIRE